MSYSVGKEGQEKYTSLFIFPLSSLFVTIPKSRSLLRAKMTAGSPNLGDQGGNKKKTNLVNILLPIRDLKLHSSVTILVKFRCLLLSRYPNLNPQDLSDGRTGFHVHTTFPDTLSCDSPTPGLNFVKYSFTLQCYEANLNTWLVVITFCGSNVKHWFYARRGKKTNIILVYNDGVKNNETDKETKIIQTHCQGSLWERVVALCLPHEDTTFLESFSNLFPSHCACALFFFFEIWFYSLCTARWPYELNRIQPHCWNISALPLLLIEFNSVWMNNKI